MWKIGIDATNLQLEYPLEALVRENRPKTLFLHTGVQNASARYPQPTAAPACAVVCLDCTGDDTRLQLYKAFPRRVANGKFVVLLP